MQEESTNTEVFASTLNKLANNLTKLFEKHNTNANQLSHVLGIPMMTIRRLLTGETKDPRISTIKLIANFFNVPLDVLLEDDLKLDIKQQKARTSFVPVIDWETAAKIKTIKDINLQTWPSWQAISLGETDIIGKNSFALESRPSMFPRFAHGTILIIDPDVSPIDSDIVLVRIKNNNELTLRELIIDPPEWKLQPIISGSRTLIFSEDTYTIIGVNLLTLFFCRK